jgi:DeoR family glycerol-3-phosphate regulon repressor
MTPNLRQTEILTIARSDGRVVVDDLAARFGVTLQTVRRDLADLCEAGHLARVHGGAVPASGTANIGYDTRRRLNPDAKDRIGTRTAQAIPDAASLFLNIGTTTEAVARALMAHRNLMAVTNNLNVANILAGNPTAEVIVAGGVLRRADGGLVGDMTLEIVRQFKPDFAVIGASALDLSGDLLDFDAREVRVAQAILRQARRRVLVADGSKFRRAAPVRIASLSEIDLFFTDAPPPPEIERACAEWGTQIIVA